MAHGVHADLRAGRDLAQDARPRPGDVLGDIAVDGANQARQRLDGLGEAAQRALVARRRRRLGAHDEKAVPAAPEVIEALDELVQPVAAGEEVAGLGDRRRDALQRVVGEQPDQVEQPLAAGFVACGGSAGGRRTHSLAVAQAELVERTGIVRFEMVDVEAEHARERRALDELLGVRAD